MTIQQLDAVLEERNRIIEEQNTMWDAAEAETRSLEGTELDRDKEMSEKVAQLDAKMTRISNRMKAEAAAVEARNAHVAAGIETRDSSTEHDVQDATSTEAMQLRSLVNGEIGSVQIGYEQRDLSSVTATDGAELVPTNMHNMIHDLMVEESPILGLATVIRTAGGAAMTFPRVTSHSAAALVAEGAAIGESDPQFATLTLNAYKYAFLVDVPSELEQDAAFNVGGFVTSQGGRALGRGVDAQFISGDGSSKPQGVDNATSGVTTAGTAAVTMDELIDLEYSVLSTQRSRGTFLFNDATVAAIRKLKDGDGNYIWQRSTQVGSPDMLLGHPIFSDPNLATMATGVTFGVFGDLEGFYIRIAQGIEVERSIHSKFANDLVTYRFITRVDSGIQDTTGIRTIDNA